MAVIDALGASPAPTNPSSCFTSVRMLSALSRLRIGITTHQILTSGSFREDLPILKLHHDGLVARGVLHCFTDVPHGAVVTSELDVVTILVHTTAEADARHGGYADAKHCDGHVRLRVRAARSWAWPARSTLRCSGKAADDSRRCAARAR